MSRLRRGWLAGAGVVALGLACSVFLATPPGPRDMGPTPERVVNNLQVYVKQ